MKGLMPSEKSRIFRDHIRTSEGRAKLTQAIIPPTLARIQYGSSASLLVCENETLPGNTLEIEFAATSNRVQDVERMADQVVIGCRALLNEQIMAALVAVQRGSGVGWPKKAPGTVMMNARTYVDLLRAEKAGVFDFDRVMSADLKSGLFAIRGDQHFLVSACARHPDVWTLPPAERLGVYHHTLELMAAPGDPFRVVGAYTVGVQLHEEADVRVGRLPKLDLPRLDS